MYIIIDETTFNIIDPNNIINPNNKWVFVEY